MKLRRIRIENFKSLKNIDLELGAFNLFVGPNGSGKTNLAQALSFLSKVNSEGLDAAVSAFGGYDNIAFRRVRRTKKEIRFHTEIEYDPGDASFLQSTMPALADAFKLISKSFVIIHEFAIKAGSETIKADFSITDEYFKIVAPFDTSLVALAIHRQGNGLKIDVTRGDKVEISEKLESLIGGIVNNVNPDSTPALPSYQLFISYLRPGMPLFELYSHIISSLSMFSISPFDARQFSSPSPRPVLGEHGANLATLVDYLMTGSPDRWKGILNIMCECIPDVEDITVGFSPNRQLMLLFKEEGFERPWPADAVSDGTVRTLAMLAGAADPRRSILVIEEPENSLHPWATRSYIEFLRTVSTSRTVIVTSHSPIVIDAVKPKECYIVSKSDEGTRIDPLVALRPEMEKDFNDGLIVLSSCFDAALIPQAVPGGSR